MVFNYDSVWHINAPRVTVWDIGEQLLAAIDNSRKEVSSKTHNQ